MTIDEFKKFDIPDSPGIYFWKKGKTILYIGKATSLYDRTKSYFASDLISTRGSRIVDMVYKADSIEWQETDSVLESMIAEANAIKKYLPHYNVQEKDDKSFNYVVITREEFPRILVIRGRTLDVEKKKKTLKIKNMFGPFPHGGSLREALKIIRRMFPFADEKSLTHDKYHFYRQLGLTPDVDSKGAETDYARTIKYITLFFQGKKKELIKGLENEMKGYIKTLEFEKAAEVKNKITALGHIQDIALIKEDVESLYEKEHVGQEEKPFRIEAFDVAHMSGKDSVAVMTVVENGLPAKSEYRKFKLSPELGNNDVGSLKETLERRFTHSEWRMPDVIVIDGGAGQIHAAVDILGSKNISARIVSVVKDERHKPVGFMGNEEVMKTYKKAVLLANSEAHRFAIAYHRKLRRMKNPFRKKL